MSSRRLRRRYKLGNQRPHLIPSELSCRRLPIYLLLDISGLMEGVRLYAAVDLIWHLVHEFLGDPDECGHIWLSVIIYADEARQIVPLTELADFQMPEPKVDGKASFDAAARRLGECWDLERRPPRQDRPGDYRPWILHFTNDESLCSGVVGEASDSIWKRKWGGIATCRFDDDGGIRVRCFSRVRDEMSEEVFGRDETESPSRYLRWKIFQHVDIAMSFHAPSHVMAKWQRDALLPLDIAPDRKIPVFFLFDTSTAMDAKVLSSARSMLDDFLEDVYLFGGRLHTVLLSSLVAFNEESRQVWPLQQWPIYLPTFTQEGLSNRAGACRFLSECRDAEVKGEEHYPPLAIVITGGLDKETAVADMQQGVASLRAREWHRIVICAADDALPNDDMVLRLTSSGADAVIPLGNLRCQFDAMLENSAADS